MKVEQRIWKKDEGWDKTEPAENQQKWLILTFGHRTAVENPQILKDIKTFYPNAEIVLCSTAGEILDEYVYDDSVIIHALHFEKTKFEVISIAKDDFENDEEAGKHLAISLEKPELNNILVISDGQVVNGSKLVKGIHRNLKSETVVTGGLAGDSVDFEKTAVGHNEPAKSGQIVGIGFYGNALKIGYGCIGGWESFGAERLITKSEANVLYELDGQSALDLYKNYLGEHAKDLPGSALLFPLGIQKDENAHEIVRTILFIDEEKKSMTFAGDVPVGYTARLMKAGFETIIEGAAGAAQNAVSHLNNTEPDFALIISCVGRKLMLNHRIEEEVEGVREILGTNTKVGGFYSYGEISPFLETVKCELHNQTMTITTFKEE